MIRVTVVIFFLAYSASGYSQMDIGKISRLVGKKQDDKIGKLKQRTFFQVRKKLFERDPTFLIAAADTVFFMEKFEIEEATYYGMVWTRKDTVSYTYFGNEIEISDRLLFTKKGITLISNWDTPSIRTEESKYPHNSTIVYAARAVVKGNKCLIDTIKMKDLIFD